MDSFARNTIRTNILVLIASRNVKYDIFSKHIVGMSGHMDIMIYRVEVVGFDVMWFECQGENGIYCTKFGKEQEKVHTPPHTHTYIVVVANLNVSSEA